MDKNYFKWYINFNIKKYINIDDILDIIELIDNKISTDEKIYNTDILIKINRSENTQYDYICETNFLCDINVIVEFIDFKFKQIINLIKSTYKKYGHDWYIEYKLYNTQS